MMSFLKRLKRPGAEAACGLRRCGAFRAADEVRKSPDVSTALVVQKRRVDLAGLPTMGSNPRQFDEVLSRGPTT